MKTLLIWLSGAITASLIASPQDPPLVRSLGVAYLHSPAGDKLAAWYQEKLGLTVKFAEDGWTEYALPAGSRFAVEHVKEPRSAVEKQAVMLSFEVADLAAAVKTLAARGVPFFPSEKETIFDVGPSLVATFRDPDGNWAQLNQRKSGK